MNGSLAGVVIGAALPAGRYSKHDSDLIAVGGDEIDGAVPVHIGECHAPVWIAANVDARPRLGESSLSAAPKHGDRLGVAVVHQQIEMPVAVEIDSLDRVRVRSHAHMER